MRHEILTVGDVFGNAISTHRRRDLDFPLRGRASARAEETVTRAVSRCARNQFLMFQVFRESSITRVYTRGFKGLRSCIPAYPRPWPVRYYPLLLAVLCIWCRLPRSPTALPDGKSSRRHSTSIANLNINSPSPLPFIWLPRYVACFF